MKASTKSILALSLLIPVPSLGIAAAMIFWPDTAWGQRLFFLSKVWLLGLPLAWHLYVNKDTFSWSPVRKGGWLVSGLIGMAIFGFIFLMYHLLGPSMIDVSGLKKTMTKVGLDNLKAYLFCSAYWICVNSVLEEYVWRWFVVQESEKTMGSRGAIFFSAAAFTVHHIVAMKTFFDWPATLVSATCIFIGGAIWSWCYIRFRSIWPGYLSHAIVDLAIFIIGYRIIFQ